MTAFGFIYPANSPTGSDRLMDEIKILRGQLAAAGVRPEPALSKMLQMPTRLPPTRPTPVVAKSVQPTAGWRELVSDGIPMARFWEGVLNEVTLVLEASGKEALSSREIFNALPHEVSAKMANSRTGDTKVFYQKLTAWAEAGTRICPATGGGFALAKPA